MPDVLRLPDLPLSHKTSAALGELQGRVDAGADFPARSALATGCWSARNNAARHAAAFREVRETLGAMAYGSVRCAYCEDAAADEIEHIAPKTLFPSRAFDWMNYCYVCGPCNAPKSNRHAVVGGEGGWTELKLADLNDEPAGPSALLDPRVDDYKDYLEIDIGGVDAAGRQLVPTSEFRLREGLQSPSAARAGWTIEVLRLNREVVRMARETALQSYRASLLEYAQEKVEGASAERLETLRRGIMRMPHPAVLNELIRQAPTQPKVARVIAAAPEVAGWIR